MLKDKYGLKEGFGFMSEMLLFVGSGYMFGKNRILFAIILFILAFFVACVVGILIENRAIENNIKKKNMRYNGKKWSS